MDKATVYTKTAKGITQVNQRTASLSKDLMKVLKLIDGKSNFGQLMEKADIDKGQLEKALVTLAKDGFARVFETRKDEDPFAAGDDDFDFTAAGKMPASTQRVVAGAANDISELVRQQDKAEAAKRAAAQAQEAARAKAKVEMETRAKLEAEARAKAEAEKNAMQQAQRAKEASERARAELETQKRDEETRRKALAEQQARLTTEQKAKEEAESRRLAELRVRAEKEARALAEARARAEAEAAALAKARAAAEAAAKKQAEEAKGAEAELKARLKEEIEARIRAEMEELLKGDVEEQTREQMKAEIMAEARLAAKAELEERLGQERESLQRAEVEARAKAEQDSKARAENEAKLRAQAEARAAAETQARIKAEEETRQLRQAAEQARIKSEEETRQLRQAAEADSKRLREAEARAQAEAAARAREQQEVAQKIEAERRGKYEAEARAKIDSEERDKRERELQSTIEAERKAKEDAEMRARIEARARETVAEDTRAKVQAELEGDMTKRAEIEGKAQAKAYMQAKVKAEADEDDRLRAEQARKAREIADILRTKVDPDAEAPEAEAPGKRRPRRRKGVVKTLVVGLAVVFLIAIGLLHFVPLRNYAVKVEQALSAWLQDDVSIGSLVFRLVPTPHLKVENIAVGSGRDAKASHGKIHVDIGSLFGDRLSLSAVELENVSLSNEAVRRIPTWGATKGKESAGYINTILLKAVKIDVKPAVESFDANLSFARDGGLRDARLTSSGWSLAMRPGAEGVDINFNARNWNLPAGVTIPVSGVSLKGTLAGNSIVVPEFEADTMDGKVNGTLKVTWGSGVKLESDLALARVSAKDLVAVFTKAIAVTGRMDGNFSVVAEGPTLETLFQSPRAQGKFRIGEGSISNVDLVAVMQSDTAGQRAGVTKFAELTGEFGGAEHRASYRQVALQGGVLRGNGTLDIGANGALSGRLALEIRSQVAQDRGGFNVTGTVSRPIIRRGG